MQSCFSPQFSSFAHRCCTRLAILACVCFVAALPALASTVANLQRDWSNTANPNPGAQGTWSYADGNHILPPVGPWIGDPSIAAGWGPGANVSGNFLPFFFHTEVNYGDSLAGDVIVHTTDGFNGFGNGPATYRWTSAVSGVFIVKGFLWPTRLIGRANQFTLTLRPLSEPSTILASGTVPENGGVSRCHPVRFNVPGVAISPGDVLEMLVERTTVPGDFVGLRLTVSTTPCADAGDLNGDGRHDGDDVEPFVECLLTGTSTCGDCTCADMDASGTTNSTDVPLFVASLL